MRTPQLADNLRRAVLQAAIEGKLNERTNENARDLLAAIQTEKTAQQKTGKLKKNKPLAAINEEEIPFAIPENWVWVRLGDYLDVRDGTHNTPKYTPTGVPLITSKNLSNNNLDFLNIKYISFDDAEEINKRSKVDVSDILFAMIGSIGNPVLVKEDILFCIKNVALFKRISTFTNMEYIYYCLFYFQEDMKDKASGGVQSFVSLNYLRNYLIPLPPLTEQQQIVAKLNRLLTEIDELKAQEQALLATQNAFPKKLRAAILQAAMQGELNERTNENARDLLAAIQTEKAALQKTGKLKKDKPLAAINEEEIPFAIPENWVWVRLGEIGIWGSGATPNRSNPDFYRNGDINWLKTGDLNDGYIDETSEKITALAVEKSSVTLQPIGAVLIAMYGATIGKLGILNIPATTNQACCACVPFKGVLNKYLFYFLLFNRSNFILMGAGGAQPNISKEKIVSTLIPLPPLTEQQQIVAKLEALLAEIEILENAS